MPQLYTIAAPGVTFQPNKCLVGLFNGVGSGRVIRVFTITMLNNQIAAITGVPLVMSINRLSTGSGGIAILPLKHDTQNETLPSQIVTGTGLTYTQSAVLRRWIWSSDEPIAAGLNSIDELETTTPLMTIVDSSLSLASASNIQPFTVREGEGFGIINNTNTVVGLCDIFMTISVEET